MDIQNFTSEWYHEPPLVVGARERGEHLAGRHVDPATGGLLRSLARALEAEAVVQSGGDGGISSLYLLAGMDDNGVLTAIESDPATDAVAREVFREARTGHRVRPITGRGLDVISRLADHAYDMLVVGAGVNERAEHLTQARRLLRDGGVAVFLGVFGQGHAVLDASRRDDQTGAARHFLAEVSEDPSLQASLLPIADGALVVFFTAPE